MQRACDECGEAYEAQRSTSKFCSSSCRVRANGAAPKLIRPAVIETAVSQGAGTAVHTAKALLESADKMGTPQAAAALALGALLDAGVQSGAASIAKEYQAAIASALEGVQSAAHPMDELMARRVRRRA